MPETNVTKKCSQCTYKPLSEFNKHSGRKDGLQSACKGCSRASQSRYAKTEAGKATQAKASTKYAKTDAGKRSHAKYRKTAAGKLVQCRYDAKYQSANPIKIKAQNSINNAIRDGRMEKPTTCEECPSTGKIQAHHDDYALPLVVRWLCRTCHIAWHAENGPGLNG